MARQCYEKILRQDPLHAGALVDLGDYWERRRNFDSALELYDKAIALLRGKICGECPDELEYAYHVKICLLEETGRPEEAERCLREALRLCPDSDLLRNRKIVICLDAGPPSQA